MARSIDEVIAGLPKARRDSIESKAVRLVRDMVKSAVPDGKGVDLTRLAPLRGKLRQGKGSFDLNTLRDQRRTKKADR